MKVWIFGGALLAGALLAPGAALAGSAVDTTQLFLNGSPLIPEVPARIVNGNTLVPIRIIAENLGSKVSWDGPIRQVTITRGTTKIILAIDKQDVTVNGSSSKLEVAPTIVDGSTLLPIRFVSEQLGVKVTWDELTRSVFLYKKADTASATTGTGSTGDTGAVGTGTAAGTGTSVGTGTAVGTGTSAGAGTAVGTGTSVGTGTAAGAGTAVGTGTAVGAGTAVGTGASAGSGTAGTGTGAGAGNTSGVTTPSGAQTPGTARPPVASAAELDGNVKPGIVSAIEFDGDRLTIKSTGVTSKPNLFSLSGPNRLVVDIPYSALDEGLRAKLVGTVGEIPLQHPLAQRIRFSNYSSEPSTVRIIIDLKARAELVAADPKTVPAGQIAYELKQIKFRVVIDPGHGDGDSGAVSLTGKTEKAFNLSMGLKVADLLKKEEGVDVLLTRNNDTFIPLDDRVTYANSMQADLFLSIHGNKTNKASISGTETYYYREESLDFANVIHKYVVSATGFPNRGVRQEPFRVIKGTAMPGVLVEVGYLSNKNDEKQMYDDAFQSRIAASLVAAIKDYLNIK